MDPAFSSTRQAAGFGLLLLVLLLLPLLPGSWTLPPREAVYASIPWRLGGFPFIQHEIFEEKQPIDIAFLGPSHLWGDIDTSYVQQALSEKLGRPAVVVTLGWAWHGLDATYFLTKDLLERRKVRMIVLDDDYGTEAPHCEAWRWYRERENSADLEGLSWRYRLYYYFGAVIGMPRNLLARVRSNLPPQNSPEQKSRYEQRLHESFPSDHLGSRNVQMGFDWRPDLFFPAVPTSAAHPGDARLFSKSSQAFDLSEPLPPGLQTYFARKIEALAQKHDTLLVSMLLPRVATSHDSVLKGSPLWLNGAVQHPLVGVPPALLFSGLSDEAILKLFADPMHLNENGQKFYTPVITPALLQLYESQVNR